MNSEIINRIKNRLGASELLTTFRPVDEEALRKAEARLGFTIPPLLREIYANVANGGFGPGYGIIGIEGGRTSNLGTLEDTYIQIKRGADYLGLDWKPGLLGFCEWGCNIFSCVDCNDMRYKVFQSEECITYAMDYTLEDFFSMWLDGVDILGVSISSRRMVEMTNPFTRKKMHSLIVAIVSTKAMSGRRKVNEKFWSPSLV